MRKISFLLICTLFIQVAFAQKSKIVTVSNLNELISAIGSDKIIKIKSNKILFSDLKKIPDNAQVQVEEVFDGLALTINNVKNLRIEGDGSKAVKLITNTRYAHVLTFKNCENIEIVNVEAGHGPGKGYCVGGVFAFYKSSKITIQNSLLFGSGTEGITMEDVQDAKFNNITIQSCTYGIMTLTNTRNIEFTNCHFTDNQEFDMVNIFNSENINFISCHFDYNRSGTGAEYDNYALFNAPLGTGFSKNLVILKKCVIEDNYSPYFCRSGSSIKMEDCQMDNNLFVKGFNSNK